LDRPFYREINTLKLRDLISPLFVQRSLPPPRLDAAATPVRIHSDFLYDIHRYDHPGGRAYLVHFKKEALRVLLPEPPAQDPLLKLVLDAKLASAIPLTLHDRAALKMAEIPIPREAGRYRDVFPE
jgi:hypothetical protein